MTIRINEVFGPTIQGEGPSTGRHCLFVRVSRCNLHCAWCDTPYTWAHTDNLAEKHVSGHRYSRADEEVEMTVMGVLTELEKLWPISISPTTVVISGGEPMLQQKELMDLVELLAIYGCMVEIETAGTITPIASYPPGTIIDGETYEHPVVSPFVNPRTVHYNVSPKLAHSGNTMLARRNEEALKALGQLDSAFKFVVSNKEQFDEVEQLIEIANIGPDRVWIMPEGTNTTDLRRHGLEIIDYALAKGWNFSMRNHVWLWGEERGK